MTDAHAAGILPCQNIEELIAEEAITSADAFRRRSGAARQPRPAAGRARLAVRASFLPGLARKVPERLKDVAMHELDLTKGAVLEKGCVYIAEIQERLALPMTVSARGNPKSSTGRVDVFVRLLTDHSRAFDDVDAGYTGPALYRDRAADLLGAGPGRHAPEPAAPEARRAGQAGHPQRRRRPDAGNGIVGFRGRRHAGVVDLDHEDGHDPRDYWEPLEARHGELLLDPGEFYILASKEDIEIPVLEAAEMTPIDPSVGEFRVHYAGFFDPGFGTEEASAVGLQGRAGSAQPRDAVPAGGRPDRRAAGL
jgi:dCTP deaminase